MAIYRGAGGAGDATADASSEASLIKDLAVEVQADADAAAASAAAAAASASAAQTAETNAETAETNAETAEANAETAQAAAEAAQSAAETAQAAAEAAQTAAETAETNAETAATNAASSASAASTSATNASNSASAAATSATNAANSVTAAQTAQAAAEAAFDAFDDIYLGAKSSNPTVDNDGNALTTGDQYFNTVSNELRIWNGSSWQTASTVGGTVTSLNVTDSFTVNSPINLGSSGTASSPILRPSTDTNTGLYFPSSDNIGLATNGILRFRIDSNGNTQLGGASSSSKLNILANNPITIQNAGQTHELDISFPSSQVLQFSSYHSSGSDLAFKTTPNGGTATERMRIDSSGNVGIGTSSPYGKLDAVGTVYVSSAASNPQQLALYANSTASYVTSTYQGSGSYKPLAFEVGGSERARIDTSGNFAFNSGYGSVATAYGCRAWVNFNGTGTVAIRASGNVSSITDTGTGQYTINLTTAMPDLNYGVVDATGQRFIQTEVATTSTMTVVTRDSGQSLVDTSNIYAAVFR